MTNDFLKKSKIKGPRDPVLQAVPLALTGRVDATGAPDHVRGGDWSSRARARYRRCVRGRVDGETIWSRKKRGRFPELKELKQLVRERVAPDKDLGHSET